MGRDERGEDATSLVLVVPTVGGPSSVETALAEAGIGVEMVEGVEQAVTCLRRGEVDLIVIDANSQREGACDLVRRVRTEASTHGVPVLVICSHSDDSFCRAADDAGADEVVVVAGSRSVLRMHVRTLLRLRDAARRLTAQDALLAQLQAQTEAALSESASKLEESRQQIMQAQKMESVGRLAGGVAHDFNNVLTSIICFTRFVVDDMSPSDPRRADLIEVLKAADSATRLTHQLLAFSRRSPVRPVVLDLNAAVSNVDRVLRRTLGSQVELVILPADAPMCCLIDPGQLDQLIFNMAFNARDAMTSGGTITLRVSDREITPGTSSAPGEYVVFTCTDTGEGMSPEVQSRVFDPFFTTKGDKGTGLGLATCYGIVSAAGGRILVESSLGKGTTFAVLLPRVHEQSQADPRRSLSMSDIDLRGTALVVEDQPAVLRTMTRALEAAGLTVLSASSAEDALSVLAERGDKIDLLATDVMLPGMSGITLADKLRARVTELRVLFVSGHAYDVPEHDATTRDHAVFLPKPFSGRQLVMRAAALLAGEGQRA